MGLVSQIRLYRQLERQRNRLNGVDVARMQEQLVLDFVRRMRLSSVFYRERYAGLPADTLEQFHRLPTIDKSVMMANFDQLNTENLVLSEVMAWAVDREVRREYLGYFHDQYVVGLSSGTSGNKGIYVTPRRLTAQVPALFLARGGLSLSDLPMRILFLLRVFSQGFQDINSPLVSLKYLSTMTPVPEILASVGREKSNILMAPPSLVRVLLPHATSLPRFKKIVCYAEVLEKEEKLRFEAAFRTPVIEIYQASEGQIASACSHGRLHINEDLVYVELRDSEGERVTQPGVLPARMLVTNLVNDCQPLIRYEMNDLLVLAPPCSCGSAFRTVDRIIGRNDDVLWLPGADGQRRPLFPDLVSRWIITASDSIREFQVVQKAPDLLLLKIELVPEGDWGQVSRHLKTRISTELASYGLSARLELSQEALPLPADGRKPRRFIALAGHPKESTS